MRDKGFNIAKIPKYDKYQRGLSSMVYKFFHKNNSGCAVKNESMSNQELDEELHKPIIRKFGKRKVYSSFIDNLRGTDLANMELLSTFDKGICFLLCAMYIYSKYLWVIPLKGAKGITITNAFQKILDESNRKPKKIWVDKGSEFHNRSMKSWLQDNDLEMYSTHNGGKSVITERFIKTFKFTNT